MSHQPANSFYVAWVDPTETTFGTAHHRYDEQVAGFTIEHGEGGIPTLNLTVRNPGIGLLAPGRKLWLWLAWDDNGTVTPLFFGRLVGVPDAITKRTVTLKFVARPARYAALKQAAAEALKVAPYYDPIFLRDTQRDDPDAILEGYSALYHVDRLASAVTVSDILVGEDGTETFDADVPFDSVQVSVGQAPLTAVGVVGDVSWTQAASGFVNLGAWSFETYAGEGVINDWPRPLAELGGGWSAAYSVAVDAYRVGNAQSTTYTYNWQNNARTHANGDTMSASVSMSAPLLPHGAVSVVVSSETQNGFIDPFAVDDQGDPAPLNIPEMANATFSYVPLWRVNTSLIARYDAARQRSERVHLLVRANVQAVLTDDGTGQGVETISVSGGDVGEPVVDVLNWSSVAGQSVALGQIVLPDAPTLAGQATLQVATTAGVAGTAQPAFSDVAGATTADNTVVWTSLGNTSAPSAAPDWKASAYTPAGTIILPRVPVWIPWVWLTQGGLQSVPQQGTQVNVGTIVRASNGSFQECVTSGTTGTAEPSFSGVPGALTLDGDVTWASLGYTLPTGYTLFLATTGGVSGAHLPAFNATKGTTTPDNSVVWTSLGPVAVPVGGWPGNTPRASYFPTDRGLQSLEHLICRARAVLRARSRAVQISFDCRFERAIALSCRKNAVLVDKRLPGGQAGGKITNYRIVADGNSGRLYGSVTIGCAVGYGDAITVAAGTESYVEAGYFEPGVQVMTGATVAAAPEDIAYTPPVASTIDDGLVFPLSRAQAVRFELLHGSLEAQKSAVEAALADTVATAPPTTPPANDFNSLFSNQKDGLDQSQTTVETALKQNPIWLELELANLTAGPYRAEYFVSTAPLVIPQTIDLEAAAVSGA